MLHTETPRKQIYSDTSRLYLLVVRLGGMCREVSGEAGKGRHWTGLPAAEGEIVLTNAYAAD